MIHYTIENLVSGNSDVIMWYQKANEKWNEILIGIKNDQINELAERLSVEQISYFETNCGGRHIGQEIMVATGFGRLYSTQHGFESNKKKALLIKKAFARSMCSLEVKFYAKMLAKDYGLED